MMHGLPGGFEWLFMSVFGCFLYILPIAFVVFAVIYLIKIRSTVEAIQKKLEQLEQKDT